MTSWRRTSRLGASRAASASRERGSGSVARSRPVGPTRRQSHAAIAPPRHPPPGSATRRGAPAPPPRSQPSRNGAAPQGTRAAPPSRDYYRVKRPGVFGCVRVVVNRRARWDLVLYDSDTYPVVPRPAKPDQTGPDQIGRRWPARGRGGAGQLQGPLEVRLGAGPGEPDAVEAEPAELGAAGYDLVHRAVQPEVDVVVVGELGSRGGPSTTGTVTDRKIGRPVRPARRARRSGARSR